MRTRNLLHEALMDLLDETDYDRISVRDIVERADVARPTFYLHFKDKHELLWSCMEHEFDRLRERMGRLSGDSLLVDGKPLTYILFDHVQGNAAFYRTMISERGAAEFLVRFLKYMAGAFYQKHEALRKRATRRDLPHAMMTHHLAGSLLGLILWWLEHDCRVPAEHMAHAFTRLCAPGVLGALGLDELLADVPPLTQTFTETELEG